MQSQASVKTEMSGTNLLRLFLFFECKLISKSIKIAAEYYYSFGKKVVFLNQIAVRANIFIMENILLNMLNVFGHFH